MRSVLKVAALALGLAAFLLIGTVQSISRRGVVFDANDGYVAMAEGDTLQIGLRFQDLARVALADLGQAILEVRVPSLDHAPVQLQRWSVESLGHSFTRSQKRVNLNLVALRPGAVTIDEVELRSRSGWKSYPTGHIEFVVRVCPQGQSLQAKSIVSLTEAPREDGPWRNTMLLRNWGNAPVRILGLEGPYVSAGSGASDLKDIVIPGNAEVLAPTVFELPSAVAASATFPSPIPRHVWFRPWVHYTDAGADKEIPGTLYMIRGGRPD